MTHAGSTAHRNRRGRPTGQSPGTRALTVVDDANIALAVADDAITSVLREIRETRVHLLRAFPQYQDAA